MKRTTVSMARKIMNRLIAVILGGTLAWSSTFAATQDRISWQQLKPEEQHALRSYAGRWNDLSASRQQALLETAQRWLHMTPEQRKQAMERSKRWQQLPPEKKEHILKRYQRFRNLPPDEQGKILRRYQWYRNLPPQQQRDLRGKWEKMTPEERQRYINEHMPLPQPAQPGNPPPGTDPGPAPN